MASLIIITVICLLLGLMLLMAIMYAVDTHSYVGAFFLMLIVLICARSLL